jgi:hypothetical protein
MKTLSFFSTAKKHFLKFFHIVSIASSVGYFEVSMDNVSDIPKKQTGTLLSLFFDKDAISSWRHD